MVLVVTVLARAALAGGLDPCDDEAYYFYWSLHPRVSYFDHPPLAAWAMTAAGALFGDRVWTVRLWPLLAGTLVPVLGRWLGVRLFGRAAGDRAGLFLTLAPGFAGNGLLMTPDTLLALAWAAAVACAHLALAAPGQRRAAWWALAGVAAGLGLLAKYTMILYFGGLVLLWALLPGRRREVWLGACLAGAVSLVVFLPVLLWNASHEWVSFRFQLAHGLDRERVSAWRTVPDYLGGLLLVASPGLAVLAAGSAARAMGSADSDRRFAAAFFWPLVLLFGAAAFRGRIHPNWPMMAFFGGLLLAAADWPAYPRWARAAAWALLVAPVALLFLLAAYAALPGVELRVGGQPLRFARMEEFVGGQRLAEAVERRRTETGADFVCASRHQFFAKLAFHSPALRPLLALPRGGSVRFPWLDDRAWAGRTALIVAKSESTWQDLRQRFDRIEPAGEFTVVEKGAALRRVLFAVGWGYRPREGAIEP